MKAESRAKKKLSVQAALTPERIADHLMAGRERLLADLEGADIMEWMRAHTHLIDTALKNLYDFAWQQAAQDAPLAPDHPLTILATGGYGRAELAPHSDIDLTFVPLHDGDAFTERLVKHLYQAMMETFHTRAGLKVGYAYRLLEDCRSLDFKTRSGLLDARFVAGSPLIAAQFEQEFWQWLDPTGFLFELYQEYHERLEKWKHSALRAEPDLKNGVGGLRDFQALRWMVQIRFQVSGQKAVSTLIDHQLLTANEAAQMEDAYRWLGDIRARLQKITGEPRDLLSRARQTEIAADLMGEGEEALDRFSRMLLRHMHTMAMLAKQGMEGVTRSRLVLGIGLDADRLEIVPVQPAFSREAAGWQLWVFRLLQIYPLALGDELKRLLWIQRETNAAPLEAREIGRFFALLLSEHGRVYAPLREMTDRGVLGWALPEYGRALYWMPGDPTHEYTVGEHTLRAIQELDAFWNGDSDLSPVLRPLFEQIARPEILYMALLMHDLGKPERDMPHAEVGAEIVARRLDEWEWDEEAISEVEFLVRQHLLMAQTARQRDLHLEETIREFTRMVDTPERLQMLYLLTCADTRAVGERIWTPAQAAFLHELYQRALRALESEEPDAPTLPSIRKRVLRELSKRPIPSEQVEEHVAQMPSSYLLNVPADQMTLHIHYVERARSGEPVIEFYNSPQSPYTEMTVCVVDDPVPGLLSKIAGVLFAHEVEVHSARVFTREGPPQIALDTLWIDIRNRPLSPNQCAVLEKSLRAVLKGERAVESLLRDKGKNPDAPLFVYRLQLHGDVSDDHTVVDFQLPVEGGALYRASHALSQVGWNIHGARLGQWAGRTILSFYATDAQGSKIAPQYYHELFSHTQMLNAKS